MSHVVNGDKIKHASLFSGIGGFDLAAKWMGWENVLSCEIDPFCQKILKYHFPTTTHYGDIRQLDGTKYQGQIDVLTGGFPCQPFSTAGRRRGTEDNRFLWPQMLRVIREIQPTWIVAENVRGIVSIDSGLVFERVCSEMEANGYEVQPFCIPACAVGAPHKRDRMWFIAHRKSKQCERGEQCGSVGRKSEAEIGNRNSNITNCWNEPCLEATTRLCRMDDGLPGELDRITIPKWRKESIRAYGNAIVPHVAYQIFKAIQCSAI